MKKLFDISIYVILFLLIIGSTFYSRLVLQNAWIFIILFRVVFPLLMTFSIFLSHHIYKTKKNIANLLLGWGLIIPGGLVSLFFVLGLKLPGLSILLPIFISMAIVVIVDIFFRRIASKIPSKTNGQLFLTKEIKNKLAYYGLLALMYNITIVFLTIIF